MSSKFSNKTRMWPTLKKLKNIFVFMEPTLTKCGLHKTSTMGSFPLMENLALLMPSLDSLAFKSLPNSFPSQGFLDLLLKHLSDFVSLTQDNDKCCQCIEKEKKPVSHKVPIMLEMTFLLEPQVSLLYPVWFNVKTLMPNCCNLQPLSHPLFPLSDCSFERWNSSSSTFKKKGIYHSILLWSHSNKLCFVSGWGACWGSWRRKMSTLKKSKRIWISQHRYWRQFTSMEQGRIQ